MPDPESLAPAAERPRWLPVLDEKKRAKIIALLANGSSRRMAARYVGCAASTIIRTADRDPEFAEQMAAAELNAEVDALRAVRAASRKDRHRRGLVVAGIVQHVSALRQTSKVILQQPL